MTQIEKIKAEIDRLRHSGYAYNRGAYEAICTIEDFINSLPAEPVSEDLEKEIHNQAMKLHTAPTYEELRNFALHFVEWQKEQMLKDAVEGSVSYRVGKYGEVRTTINYKLPKEYNCGDKVKLIIVKED